MAEYTGHIRAMRAENDFFGAEDFVGLPDIPLQIIKCEHYEKRNACGKAFKNQFTLFLANKDGSACKKELILNATNRKQIAAMYGANVKDWKGNWIWLFATEVRSPQGGMTLGIRIRDKKDPPPQKNAPAKHQPTEQQPPEDQLKSDEELAMVGN